MSVMLLFAWLVTAEPNPADNLPGLVTGAVVDDAGTAVAGATVSLRTDERYRVVVTDGTGRFTLRAIEPGEYRVTVEHPRHRTAALGIDVGPTVTALTIPLRHR